jgi:MFS family permease
MTSIVRTANRAVNLKYVIFLGATAALGGMMFGFDIAIIVGAGPFLVEHFGLSDLGLGWAYSSLLFGCVLGSIAAGRWTDIYGRQRLLVYVAALFVIARFIGGIAVGGVSVLSPMYVAEVSPPAIRGRMGAMYQMSIAAGILISYCINYALRNAGEWNWRWMFLSGALPSVVFLATLWRAPETPRFLFQVRRNKEGRALLARIMNEEEAELEAAEIEASLVKPISAIQGDHNRKSLRRVLAIIDYAPLILKSAGWKIDAALFSTFVIGGVNCLFTMISFWTIDRYGRKPLYITGSLGMAVSLLLLILCFAAGKLNPAAVLGLIGVFIAFFASCIGPVFWTLVPEIFPNGARGRAMTVPVVTQWIANAVVVLLFPLVFHRLGAEYTFTFLACMCALQAAFIWRFVPETKGKTLEQIEEQWQRS